MVDAGEMEKHVIELEHSCHRADLVLSHCACMNVNHTSKNTCYRPDELYHAFMPTVSMTDLRCKVSVTSRHGLLPNSIVQSPVRKIFWTPRHPRRIANINAATLALPATQMLKF
jgi:hypothetical protein